MQRQLFGFKFLSKLDERVQCPPITDLTTEALVLLDPTFNDFAPFAHNVSDLAGARRLRSGGSSLCLSVTGCHEPNGDTVQYRTFK
jgi:hypothetical protein